MPAAWPSTLPPTFERDGFQSQEPNLVLASPMEVGPPKRRRRTTAAPWRMSGTILCDQTQVATFRTFGLVTLGGWVLPFSGFVNPITQTSIVAACFDTDQGPPSYQPVADRLRIGFAIYILP